MPQFRFLKFGAVFGALAVVFGAFAAHGLKGRLDPRMLAVFEIGVRYQMYHALALVAVAAGAAKLWSHSLTATACWAWILGITLFSGSLYLLALTGVRWIGFITPFGGVSFIVGWALLAIAAWAASRPTAG